MFFPLEPEVNKEHIEHKLVIFVSKSRSHGYLASQQGFKSCVRHTSYRSKCSIPKGLELYIPSAAQSDNYETRQCVDTKSRRKHRLSHLFLEVTIVLVTFLIADS